MGTITFEKISEEDAWIVFDNAAKRLLRMPGSEFARRWDSGELKANPSPEMMEVLVLRPPSA
jgi:hypothetical protein